MCILRECTDARRSLRQLEAKFELLLHGIRTPHELSENEQKEFSAIKACEELRELEVHFVGLCDTTSRVTELSLLSGAASS